MISFQGCIRGHNVAGGQVVVRSQRLDRQTLEIRVLDTGLGLDDAQMAELFQPFNRLGREQPGNATGPGTQGTGIGLVICRKLAELMGGELAVASQPGAGSVFTLSLPRPLGEPTRTSVTSAMPLMPASCIRPTLSTVAENGARLNGTSPKPASETAALAFRPLTVTVWVLGLAAV